MNEQFRLIAESAYENFSSSAADIDRVKEDITKIRRGSLNLSDIQTDKERLSNRIAREGMSQLQALERINGEANFQDIHILQKIFELSKSVGRITASNRYGNTGFGTGFLIAPNLIITNNHVIGDSETANNSTIQFNYELDNSGNPKNSESFNLRPEEFFVTSHYQRSQDDPYSGLDFSIVAIDPRSTNGIPVEQFPVARLDIKTGKIIDGENCVVVQHPKGDYKKIVMKDIRMLVLKDDFLIYESDTLPGSSGSMVLGLGTGEVVALHHSGVPKKNRHGQWLRKDGSVAQAGDSDDVIDWMGNEGIRVSSILKMVDKIPVDGNMSEHKKSITSGLRVSSAPSRERISTPVSTSVSSSTPASVNQPVSRVSENGSIDELYFEVELSEVKEMQKDWKENAGRLVPGLISSERLYPLSTEKHHKRMYYVTVSSDQNPWQIAEQLEALPQVESCTPDLPMQTDINPGHYLRWKKRESFESLNDGTANWEESESDFKSKWRFAANVRDFIEKNDSKGYRSWNRTVVNIDKVKLNGSTNAITKNADKVSIVQLDTGYTDHSKVSTGYDLNRDEDFIDGEDARDEMVQGVVRHPGHGTRTASIVVGREITDVFVNDGNKGILQNGSAPIMPVIPYRVSQSVVLIGRGRNIFDAVLQAINSNVDIVFMCLGSYPRPMLYSIAKLAYDKGLIWVCAAGNEVESIVAPAMYPGTIAVAASNPNNEIWRKSSYGEAVDIAAPGEDVYVPFEDEKGNDIMVFGSGTSYATPHVASAAALWKAKYYDHLREAKPWQVVELFRACLKASATNLAPPYDNKEKFGAGILNIEKLLSTHPDKVIKIKDLKYAYHGKEGPTKMGSGCTGSCSLFVDYLETKNHSGI